MIAGERTLWCTTIRGLGQKHEIIPTVTNKHFRNTLAPNDGSKGNPNWTSAVDLRYPPPLHWTVSTFTHIELHSTNGVPPWHADSAAAKILRTPDVARWGRKEMVVYPTPPPVVASPRPPPSLPDPPPHQPPVATRARASAALAGGAGRGRGVAGTAGTAGSARPAGWQGVRRSVRTASGSVCSSHSTQGAVCMNLLWNPSAPPSPRSVAAPAASAWAPPSPSSLLPASPICPCQSHSVPCPPAAHQHSSGSAAAVAAAAGAAPHWLGYVLAIPRSFPWGGESGGVGEYPAVALSASQHGVRFGERMAGQFFLDLSRFLSQLSSRFAKIWGFLSKFLPIFWECFRVFGSLFRCHWCLWAWRRRGFRVYVWWSRG